MPRGHTQEQQGVLYLRLCLWTSHITRHTIFWCSSWEHNHLGKLIHARAWGTVSYRPCTAPVLCVQCAQREVHVLHTWRCSLQTQIRCASRHCTLSDTTIYFVSGHYGHCKHCCEHSARDTAHSEHDHVLSGLRTWPCWVGSGLTARTHQPTMFWIGCGLTTALVLQLAQAF